ncbi:MAG: peptidoglycan DD-metalloendopeptidase family protein [Sedimenticola sp.]|nr:peptidoglycan DD-metalloendopeptidase family protein [Sedimenticola sp.]
MLISNRRLTRALKALNVCLLLLLFSQWLIGCTAPVRAPVVSRDTPTVRHTASRPTTYRVQSGDTLYSIAWRFGINYSSIARWNGIRYPYTIYPGQRLTLAPVKKAYKRPATSPSITKTPKSQGAVSPSKPVVSDKRVSQGRSKSVTSSASSGKKTPESLKLQWLWPTQGTLAERFVKGDPVRKGVKIKGRYGATVKAAESGKVVYAGNGLIGYGRLVIIKHNKNYLSAYGYNRKIHVKEGDTVKKGVRIAEMGSDGNGKPMLHFEIRRNGAPIDPLKLLPRHP